MNNHIGIGIFEVGVRQMGWMPTSEAVKDTIKNLYELYYKLLNETRNKACPNRELIAGNYKSFCDDFVGIETELQSQLDTDDLVFFKAYVTEFGLPALQYTITDMTWDGESMVVINTDVSADDLAYSRLTIAYMDDLIYG